MVNPSYCMDGFPDKAVLPILAALIFVSAASAVSINLLSTPYDSETVSPNSQVGQVVELVDAEGDPMNRSSLENRSNLDFKYVYEGNKSSIEHLDGGYYYALFSTSSSVEDLEFELIQNSVAGELNRTEELETGNLDVDITSNFTGDFEANEDITVEATVEDLTNYKYADSDGSGGISSGDVVVVDRGGSGTYSTSSDEIFAGVTPENMMQLSGGNSWSDVSNQIAFNDSNFGDEWNPGADLILLDYNSGGTVSTSPDEMLNSGTDTEIDADSGQELNSLSGVGADIYFVSEDNQYDSEESTVFDNDSDQVYTGLSDLHVAGEVPPEGEPVTHEDTMPDGWQISSYDASGGGEWNPSTDFLAIDNDNDSVYTARADIVLSQSAPPEAAQLENSGYDDWNDANPNVVSAGDLEVHDNVSGDAWDPSKDAIWVESGGAVGYQSSQDQLVAPSSADEILMPNKNSGIFSQWNTISAYDSGDTSTFDPSVDSVVRDFYGGGTYSASPDSKIAGTIPTGFTGGTSYSKVDGFADAWELDARRPVDTGGWSGSRDTILKDRNEGGTYSKVADTVINAEGGVEASSGTSLTKLNTVTQTDLMWVDVDQNGNYDQGDEIVRDLDEDQLYTKRSDQHLAGVSLTVAGQGTPLRTFNNWKNKQKPVLFHDNSSGDQWNSSEDSIVYDTDSDGVYTSQSDTVIQGTASSSIQGTELQETGRTDFTTPDLYARITSGVNTSQEFELGRNPGGNYTGSVKIPDQFGTNFLLQVRAEDPTARVYGFASEELGTRAEGIGFDAVENDIEIQADIRGNYTRNITVKNYLETQNTINVSLTDSIGNITSMSTEQLTIEPNGNRSLSFSFNLSELQDYEGSIEFKELSSGKQEEVDVEINAPNCYKRTENLCRTDEGEVYVLAESRNPVDRTVQVSSLSEESQEVDISVNGNISDYVSFNDTVTVSGAESIELGFDPQVPGNFTGNMSFSSNGESFEVMTRLEADFEELESSFELTPSSLELGSVPDGNSETREIQLTNTGTLELENISVSSSEYSLSTDITESVSESSSRNYSITFQSIRTESGTVTVEAETSRNNVSRDISVSASVIQPVSDMKSDVRSTISDLRTRASSPDTMTQLSNLQTKVSSIQSQWDQGNYQRAQEIYQNTKSTLNNIDSQIQSSSSTGGTGTGGSQQPQQPQQPQQESGGGGGAMIIVLVLLVLILGAGFVVYTSYYPEEGDPLYDVLGDR